MATPLLIVDDSAISRKMIKKSLPPGWDVVISEAANGQEALAAYREGKADIMFLDLTMPVMDGYQVLEALKKDGLNCFVIVISADIQPKARERVMQLGAMDFIQKPIDNKKLTEVLRKYGIEL